MNELLVKKVAELQEKEAVELAQHSLDNGADPMEILNSCQQGMVLVGEKFEQGEYYISDLMMSGEIFQQISKMLTPKLAGASSGSAGKIVLGTVAGDIHDIGKDLVLAMLKSASFDVSDLGVDVSAERFVDEVKQTGATVLALSCLLTTAYDAIRDTVKAIEAAGLRSKVKVMIGGGPIDEKCLKYTGADVFGHDAQAAVRLAKELI